MLTPVLHADSPVVTDIARSLGAELGAQAQGARRLTTPHRRRQSHGAVAGWARRADHSPS